MTTNYFDWEVWQTTDALGMAATIRAESVPLRSITAQLAEAVNLQNPKLNAVVELFDDVIEAPERSGAESKWSVLWGTNSHQGYGLPDRRPEPTDRLGF